MNERNTRGRGGRRDDQPQLWLDDAGKPVDVGQREEAGEREQVGRSAEGGQRRGQAFPLEDVGRDYETFLDAVRRLEFMGDEMMVDSSVKAVLGMLASRLDEKHARELCDSLPPPLTYERLRGHQLHTPRIPAENWFGVIAHEMGITEEQAGQVIQEVLRVTKRCLSPERLQRIRDNMPREWAAVFDAA